MGIKAWEISGNTLELKSYLMQQCQSQFQIRRIRSSYNSTTSRNLHTKKYSRTVLLKQII